jgi:transportin-1
MQPVVNPLLERMLPILSSVKASPNLLENTAVSMGRLALAAPQEVAPNLGNIIRIWSQAMMHVSAGPEQDSALRGMCEAAKYNPAAIREGGEFLLQALAKSTHPSEELRAVSAPVSLPCDRHPLCRTTLTIMLTMQVIQALQH